MRRRESFVKAGGSGPGELIIWGRLTAYNVPKVVWAAEELGLAYRRIDAGRAYGVVDTADYLAMNPNGRVPTIEDGDFTLWESNVIVRYLCGRYGLGGMCPDELQARMEAEKWMDWEATNLFRAFFHAQAVVDQKTHTFTVEQTEAAFAHGVKVLQTLEARLAENRYVAGDAFTMGDIPIAVLVDRLVRAGADMAGLPNVSRWHGSLIKRPAMCDAMAVQWARSASTRA